MMFNHSKIRKLISAYFDGEINEKDKLLVENHLKECADCYKYYQDLQKVSFALSQDKGEDVSPDLAQRIKTNFLGDKYKGEAKMKNKKLVIGISSGALAILLMFIFVGSMQTYVRKELQGKVYDAKGYNQEQYFPQSKGDISTVEAERAKMLLATGGQKQNILHQPTYTNMSLARVAPSTITTGQSSVDYAANKTYADAAINGYAGESLAEPNEEGPIVIVEQYLPATGKEDKLIRTADATIEVKDVEKAYDEVVKISTSKKGYLATANFKQTSSGKIMAQLVLRVPKDKFEETVDELRKLGEVKNFDIEGVDVSQEYNTLVTELNTIKVVYDKIEQKLKEKKTDIQGAMRLESELTPYARRIEVIRNQLAKYDNLISMSTIMVNLEATSWKVLFQENLKDAQRRLAQIASGIVRGLISLLPFILTLVCIAVVVVGVISIIKNALKKKSS